MWPPQRLRHRTPAGRTASRSSRAGSARRAGGGRQTARHGIMTGSPCAPSSGWWAYLWTLDPIPRRRAPRLHAPCRRPYLTVARELHDRSRTGCDRRAGAGTAWCGASVWHSLGPRRSAPQQLVTECEIRLVTLTGLELEELEHARRVEMTFQHGLAHRENNERSAEEDCSSGCCRWHRTPSVAVQPGRTPYGQERAVRVTPSEFVPSEPNPKGQAFSARNR